MDSLIQALYNQLSHQSTSISANSNIQFHDNLLPAIYFDSNSDNLDVEAYKRLARISKLISNNKIQCLNILGHTDEYHTENYNQDLGLKRALAVKNVLQNNFLTTDIQINIKSLGELEPIIEVPILPSHHAINQAR